MHVLSLTCPYTADLSWSGLWSHVVRTHLIYMHFLNQFMMVFNRNSFLKSNSNSFSSERPEDIITLHGIVKL